MDESKDLNVYLKVVPAGYTKEEKGNQILEE
jgi:hypothetical protein